jgi:small basic protein (TIGR04137 family)
MSIHKSLKLKNTLVRQRSVLSRWERIEKLREVDKWQEGDAVTGLPKVRTKFKLKSRKAQLREAAEAAQGGGGQPAEGAADEGATA